MERSIERRTRRADGGAQHRRQTDPPPALPTPAGLSLADQHGPVDRASGNRGGSRRGHVLLTWWLVAAAVSDDAFARVQWFLATPIGLLVLFGWTVALFFHFFAGLRHLVWDAGYGFEQPWYDRSAWAVVIATGVATLLLWVIGLAVW